MSESLNCCVIHIERELQLKMSLKLTYEGWSNNFYEYTRNGDTFLVSYDTHNNVWSSEDGKGQLVPIPIEPHFVIGVKLIETLNELASKLNV